MKIDGVHALMLAKAGFSGVSFKETLERNVDNPMF